MSQNHLKFDDDKSDVILFGPPNSISSFGANRPSNASNNMKQAARNRGVIFDTKLCFDTQVKWSCFFKLNILPKTK